MRSKRAPDLGNRHEIVALGFYPGLDFVTASVVCEAPAPLIYPFPCVPDISPSQTTLWSARPCSFFLISISTKTVLKKMRYETCGEVAGFPEKGLVGRVDLPKALYIPLKLLCAANWDVCFVFLTWHLLTKLRRVK